MTAALTRLATDFRRAGSGNGAARTSVSLRAMKSALDRSSARLAGLHSPRDAADAQRSLVAGLRDYAAQVDLVRASVDFGDPATIVAHLHAVTAPAGINRTLDSLSARGYDIPVRIAAVKGS